MSEYNYGFLITTFNDGKEASEMFDSLKESIPARESYKVVVIDGGSDEQNIGLITSNIGSIQYTHKDLSSALNAGYYVLMGYQPDGSNIQELVNTGVSSTDYIIWLHSDMRFTDYNWVNKLIWCYEYLFPLFGKLCPGTRNIDNSSPDVPLRGGNSTPHVMGNEVLRKLIETYGWIFNPKYINIGGCEDWDKNRRLSELGYGFGICSLMDVWHKGAGVRFLRDTTADQIYNREVYEQIWNIGREPGFEIDLIDIGKQLKIDFEKKFGDNLWYKE